MPGIGAAGLLVLVILSQAEIGKIIGRRQRSGSIQPFVEGVVKFKAHHGVDIVFSQEFGLVIGNGIVGLTNGPVKLRR